MTNFDVYERILQGTARLERRLDAKKHDKDALKIAMLWRKLPPVPIIGETTSRVRLV